MRNQTIILMANFHPRTPLLYSKKRATERHLNKTRLFQSTDKTFLFLLFDTSLHLGYYLLLVSNSSLEKVVLHHHNTVILNYMAAILNFGRPY